MLRIIFLGTPDFAAIPLEALANDQRYTVVGVVTQPDRPAGRGRAPEPPVKQAALRLGIPVLQAETLRDPAVVEQLAALRPDAGVVAAYGEILRKNVLAIPPLGYLNIHPSLLPRHRGPTPVSGAILAGDAESGVSVMLLDAKMDAGPILAQQRAAATRCAHWRADHPAVRAWRGHAARVAGGLCGRAARAHPPGREPGQLHAAAPESRRSDRLGRTGGADRADDARLRPLARRIHALARAAAQDHRGARPRRLAGATRYPAAAG